MKTVVELISAAALLLALSSDGAVSVTASRTYVDIRTGLSPVTNNEEVVGFKLGIHTNDSEVLAAKSYVDNSTPGDYEAVSNAAMEVVFSKWYPDGSVTNASQFTQGLKYEFDTTNHTASVKPFCNTGDSSQDNSDMVGDVVIPPYLVTNGVRYVVSSVLGVNTVGGENESLTSIYAPITIKSIGDSAFNSCTSLSSVSLPSATSIGNGAFNFCDSITSVSLPSATSIGEYAFANSTYLASVSTPSATSIGGSAFYSCNSLTSVSLPSTTSIGDSAFYSCTSLTSVSLPSATSIGDGAFDSCDSITSVSLPSAVNIGVGAFNLCTSLASVSLPFATSIGEYAFESCTYLALVDFGKDARPSIPPLGSDAFSGVTTNQLTFVIPDQQYDAWVSTNGWVNLYNDGAKFYKYSEWEAPHRYELDAKQDALPYPTNEIPYSAITNVPIIKTDSITDGTNTIDAAWNVYSVGHTNTVWIWRGSTDYGQPIWKKSDEFGFYFWWLDSLSLEPTSESPNGQNATNLVFEIDEVFVSCYRDTLTVTNYVGKLALTNDIPNVDYTTSNTQLVATIEAKAPAPGNYSAVSNAAMNARSATDLSVRGAPHGEGAWFTVNGASAQYSDIGGWLFDGGVSIYYSSGMTYNVHFPVEGYDRSTNVTLNLNYEARFLGGAVEYHIIGYTNTLAQVSDMPIASDGLPHMDGTASAGTTNKWSRVDHVHPSDTSKMDGAAAYPAWSATEEPVDGMVRFYKGRLYIVVDADLVAITEDEEQERITYGAPDNVDSLDGWHETTIDYMKQDALPYPTNAIPYDVITGGPVVSPSDPTFSNSVLAVGLNIDTNTVAAINALVEHGDGLPIGGATTVGVLLLALAAAIAALKRNKADKSDLPYSLMTATQTGDWQFSDGGTHTISVDEYDPGGQYPWAIVADGMATIDNVDRFQTKAEADAAFSSLTSCSFDVDGSQTITATRAWALQDRAVNAVSLSADTTLQLPPPVAGKSRDLLVRLTVSADAAVTFSAPTGETITWDDAGSPTATYEAGTHLLRFTEVCLDNGSHVFHFTDLGDGVVLKGKLEATSAAPAFDSTKTYSVGEHVTYNGVLYECSTAVTTAGAWTGSTNWTATDMTSPDATLDLMADGRLRLVSEGGEVLWMQGYGLASSSSVTLSCDKVNFHAFATAPAFDATEAYAANDIVAYDGVVYVFTAAHAAGAWTGSDASVYAVALAMPTAPSGKVGDFVLDVDNTANASASVTATLTGAGTAFDVFTPEGVNLSTDILTFAGGEQCELYFTMTAFGTATKHAWKVVKQVVEKQEFGS